MLDLHERSTVRAPRVSQTKAGTGTVAVTWAEAWAGPCLRSSPSSSHGNLSDQEACNGNRP